MRKIIKGLVKIFFLLYRKCCFSNEKNNAFQVILGAEDFIYQWHPLELPTFRKIMKDRVF